MGDVGYKIIDRIKILGVSDRKTTKEFNLISWGEFNPVYDLRRWKDGEPQKGLTLTKDELRELYEALKIIFKDNEYEPSQDDDDDSEIDDVLWLDKVKLRPDGVIRTYDDNGTWTEFGEHLVKLIEKCNYSTIGLLLQVLGVYSGNPYGDSFYDNDLYSINFDDLEAILYALDNEKFSMYKAVFDYLIVNGENYDLSQLEEDIYGSQIKPSNGLWHY